MSHTDDRARRALELFDRAKDQLWPAEFVNSATTRLYGTIVDYNFAIRIQASTKVSGKLSEMVPLEVPAHELTECRSAAIILEVVEWVRRVHS